MAYVFEQQPAATFKFEGKTAGAINGAMTMNGISPSATAPNVITGIRGILYIANLINKYDPLDGLRTVKENVDTDE